MDLTPFRTFLDGMHREIGVRHRARQVINAAAADLQTSACLVIDRSCSRSIIALRSAIPPW